MFHIGMGELLILLFLALVVVGPSDLPKVARTIARFLRKINAMAAEIKEALLLEEEKREIKKMESDFQDLAKEMKEIEKEAREADPAKLVKKELEETANMLDSDEALSVR